MSIRWHITLSITDKGEIFNPPVGKEGHCIINRQQSNSLSYPTRVGKESIITTTDKTIPYETFDIYISGNLGKINRHN
jgi:hypothetical protein